MCAGIYIAKTATNLCDVEKSGAYLRPIGKSVFFLCSAGRSFSSDILRLVVTIRDPEAEEKRKP